METDRQTDIKTNGVTLSESLSEEIGTDVPEEQQSLYENIKAYIYKLTCQLYC